jgi:hypothetical protein
LPVMLNGGGEQIGHVRVSNAIRSIGTTWPAPQCRMPPGLANRTRAFGVGQDRLPTAGSFRISDPIAR